MKKTSNNQHPTSNTQSFLRRPRQHIGCWRLDVGCWMFLALFLSFFAVSVRAAEPLHALLITGGCCHDYEAQKKILSEGISARANVTWTIVHEGGDTKEHQVS